MKARQREQWGREIGIGREGGCSDGVEYGREGERGKDREREGRKKGGKERRNGRIKGGEMKEGKEGWMER